MPRERITKDGYRAHAAAFAAEVAGKPQFAILAPLVHEKVTPAEAARQLYTLSVTAAGDDTAGNAANMAYDTACCSLELAKRTDPESQGPIVQTLELLRDLPPVPEPHTGNTPAIDGDRLWTDLPSFGVTITDELGSIKATAADLTPEEQVGHERVTAFAARLTALPKRGSAEWSPVDFSHQSLIAFNNAFDKDTTTPLAVRCACRWIEFAGAALWAHHSAGRRMPFTPESEPPEFDRQYWTKWKQGMAQVAEDQTGQWDADVMEMAQKALARMATAEH